MKIITYRVSSNSIKCPFDIDVLEATSLDQAVSLIDESTGAIICSPKSPDSKKWFKTVRSIAPKVSFIWYSALSEDQICDDHFFDDQMPNQFVSTDSGPDVLCNSIQAALKLEEAIEDSSYIKFPISRVLQTNLIPCDVYLRLSKSKVVKVIHKDGPYSTDMLERLKSKGVHYLLLNSDSEEIALEFISKTIRASHEISRSKAPLEHLGGLRDSLVSVGDALNVFGVSEDTKELLREINNDCINTIVKCTSAKDFIDNFINHSSYLQGHSLMCSYVAGLIALEMGWRTPPTLQKISFTSILHDITLYDDRIALIADYEPEKIKELNWREAKKVRDHHLDGAEIFKQLKLDVPAIEEMITKHHCSVDSEDIDELLATFIIAEEFSKRVYGKKISQEIVSGVILELDELFSETALSAPLEKLSELSNTMITADKG